MQDGAFGADAARDSGERVDHLHRAVIVDDDRHGLAGLDREQLPPDEVGALGYADGRRRHDATLLWGARPYSV